MGHVHVSAIQGAVIFATVLIFATAWRLVAAWTSDSGPGKAMAFML